MCKKLTGQTPFRLVYGTEALMPMEYVVASLRIAVMIGIEDRKALEERLAKMEELEEEWFWQDSNSRYRNNTRKLGMIAISSCAHSR